MKTKSEERSDWRLTTTELSEIVLPRERLTAEEFDWLLSMVRDLRRAFVVPPALPEGSESDGE